MPMYTYKCIECNKSVEMLLKMDERDTAVCPDCNTLLVRNIDRPGLVWAPTRGGSGFAT